MSGSSGLSIPEGLEVTQRRRSLAAAAGATGIRCSQPGRQQSGAVRRPAERHRVGCKSCLITIFHPGVNLLTVDPRKNQHLKVHADWRVPVE